MRISRVGAKRNRGKTTLFSVSFLATSQYSWENNVNWDSKEKELAIVARDVADVHGMTTYNYSVRLSLEDVSSLIGLLGHAASAEDAKLLRNHLSQHVPAIVKLLSCATGNAPKPISEDNE